MKDKIVFISWIAHSGRSESVARALGAKPFYVETWKGCALPLLPLRYWVQAIETWRILRRERPAVVVTMNPPPFLPLVAWAYGRLHGARFAMDSHTGALAGRRWGRFLRLHRFLSRRAVTTIVTNDALAEQVAAWGANAFVLELGLPDFPPAASGATPTAPSVVVVNSFSPDEPLEAIRQAAEMAPDCAFSVTGRIPPALHASLAKNRPPNLVYTDYLPQAEYEQLLRGARAVMALVTADHTLLQGAIEAVAVGKPLITSDWPVLRAYFRKGAIYVDNRPESIVRAVREAMRNEAVLAADMRALGRELMSQWHGRASALAALLASGGPARAPSVAEPEAELL